MAPRPSRRCGRAGDSGKISKKWLPGPVICGVEPPRSWRRNHLKSSRLGSCFPRRLSRPVYREGLHGCIGPVKVFRHYGFAVTSHDRPPSRFL